MIRGYCSCRRCSFRAKWLIPAIVTVLLQYRIVEAVVYNATIAFFFADTVSNVPELISFYNTYAYDEAVLEIAVPNANDTIRINTLYYDTECDPLKALAATSDALSKGVIATIGPECSNETEQASLLGQVDDFLPIITYASTALALSDKTTYPNVIRNCYSESNEAMSMLATCNYYGFTHISILTDDDDISIAGWASAVSSAAAFYNVTVTALRIVNNDASESDMMALLDSMFADSTNVLLVCIEDLSTALTAIAAISQYGFLVEGNALLLCSNMGQPSFEIFAPTASNALVFYPKAFDDTDMFVALNEKVATYEPLAVPFEQDFTVAYMLDSLKLLHLGISSLLAANPDVASVDPLLLLNNGSLLFNECVSQSFQGFTGSVSFTSTADRETSGITFDIERLTDDGIQIEIGSATNLYTPNTSHTMVWLGNTTLVPSFVMRTVYLENGGKLHTTLDGTAIAIAYFISAIGVFVVTFTTESLVVKKQEGKRLIAQILMTSALLAVVGIDVPTFLLTSSLSISAPQPVAPVTTILLHQPLNLLYSVPWAIIGAITAFVGSIMSYSIQLGNWRSLLKFLFPCLHLDGENSLKSFAIARIDNASSFASEQPRSRRPSTQALVTPKNRVSKTSSQLFNDMDDLESEGTNALSADNTSAGQTTNLDDINEEDATENKLSVFQTLKTFLMNIDMPIIVAACVLDLSIVSSRYLCGTGIVSIHSTYTTPIWAQVVGSIACFFCCLAALLILFFARRFRITSAFIIALGVTVQSVVAFAATSAVYYCPGNSSTCQDARWSSFMMSVRIDSSTALIVCLGIAGVAYFAFMQMHSRSMKVSWIHLQEVMAGMKLEIKNVKQQLKKESVSNLIWQRQADRVSQCIEVLQSAIPPREYAMNLARYSKIGITPTWHQLTSSIREDSCFKLDKQLASTAELRCINDLDMTRETAALTNPHGNKNGVNGASQPHLLLPNSSSNTTLSKQRSDSADVGQLSLHEVLGHPVAALILLDHAREQMRAESVAFLIDANRYSMLVEPRMRTEFACGIMQNFIVNGSPQQINISNTMRSHIQTTIDSNDNLPSTLFEAAQREVEKLVQFNDFVSFSNDKIRYTQIWKLIRG